MPSGQWICVGNNEIHLFKDTKKSTCFWSVYLKTYIANGMLMQYEFPIFSDSVNLVHVCASACVVGVNREHIKWNEIDRCAMRNLIYPTNSINSTVTWKITHTHTHHAIHSTPKFSRDCILSKCTSFFHYWIETKHSQQQQQQQRQKMKSKHQW